MNKISAVEGAHLTAADRRNVKALLAYDGFEFGRRFKVGRKVYAIGTTIGVRLSVAVTESSIDDFGRRVEHTYHSTFKV